MSIRVKLRITAGAMLLGASMLIGAGFPDPTVDAAKGMHGKETATLAGGCFWCVEAVYQQIQGVEKVVSGYSGGDASTAHYEMVSTGTTGHAESVQVTFDPTQISTSQLLAVYFLVAHDPTELNRQGPDDGSQYRSEIYYTTDAQKEEALAEIARLTHQHKFSDP